MRREHLDGIAVTIHEPDTAPRGTVVLLHGIGGCADSFTGLAPRLAVAGWRAVAWDAPGYGESTDPGSEVTGTDAPGAYVDVLATLLARLGVPRAHVAGVSWGGVIATHLAARRPDLVTSLTLIDSTRGSGTTPEKATAMRGRVDELDRQGAAAFAAARAPRLLAADPDPDAATAVQRQMAAVRVAGYAGAAEMMAQSDTGPLLADISTPTLVVVGEEDRITGVEESRVLARMIAHARFALVPHAGHAAAQERPAEVAGHLLDFLDAVSAPRDQEARA